MSELKEICRPEPMRMVQYLPEHRYAHILEPQTITVMSRCHEYEGEWEPERDSVIGWWLRQIPKDAERERQWKLNALRRKRDREKRYHWRDALECSTLRTKSARVDYDKILNGAEFNKVPIFERCQKCNALFEQS